MGDHGACTAQLAIAKLDWLKLLQPWQRASPFFALVAPSGPPAPAAALAAPAAAGAVSTAEVSRAALHTDRMLAHSPVPRLTTAPITIPGTFALHSELPFPGCSSCSHFQSPHYRLPNKLAMCLHSHTRSPLKYFPTLYTGNMEEYRYLQSYE